MMKAVICTKYGPPEVLQIKEIDKPTPRDNEVLVKVFATSVSAADQRVRSFNVPTLFWLPAKLALGFGKPRKSILGMELSGEIEAIGENVKAFKKGEKVFAATLQSFGSYGEYVCLKENGPIVTKPQFLKHEEAAVIPIGARTAFHYLKTIAEIKPEQKVLIYGASGSVGTYAVQLAKYFGAEVTGVCSTTNLEMVKSLGADKVIDYTKSNFKEHFETYDIIFVTVDKLSFSTLKNALQKNGFYLNIGRPVPSFQMIWTSLTSKIKVVVGKNAPETRRALCILKNIIEQGKLEPVIDRIYTLDHIVEAHRYVDKGHKKGNVVISIA